MKISVVVAVGGSNIDRYTNALKQLEVLQSQTFQPLEIIYVEQIVDGNAYFNQLPILFDNNKYRYIPIIFREHPELFSVAWCRNVGVYQSIGDVVVVLDVDYVFDNHYIETVSKLDIQDIYAGWNVIYYIHNQEKVKYMQQNIFPVGEETPEGLYKNKLIHRVGHVGGIQVFNRSWFIDNLGGFSEDMFGWGTEDCDLYARAGTIIGTERELIYNIYHLHHSAKQPDKLINKITFQKNMLNPKDTARLLKEVGVGNIDHPSPVYGDSIKWSL